MYLILPLVSGIVLAVVGCGQPTPVPAGSPDSAPVVVAPTGPPDSAPVLTTPLEVAPEPRALVPSPAGLSKQEVASLQCEFFEEQCKRFRAKYQRFPFALAELVDPPSGSVRPLVAGGREVFITPWRNSIPYVYEIQDKSEPRIYCFADDELMLMKPVFSPRWSKKLQK